MTDREKMFIEFIKLINDKDIVAVFLQNEVQQNGPFSDEASEEIKAALEKMP